MKKILVIGSGGREHAIAYKFKCSPQVEEVYVAPGNPGMRDVATLVPIQTNEFDKLIEFVKENKIDLTFVGPEIPLCAGIVDEFHKANLEIFGPTKAAAELEGSKVFSKAMMKKYNIP
ncbi:MAG: phosphoribosylamine--glycine ligase, partial [Longicatena sp.]